MADNLCNCNVGHSGVRSSDGKSQSRVVAYDLITLMPLGIVEDFDTFETVASATKNVFVVLEEAV